MLISLYPNMFICLYPNILYPNILISLYANILISYTVFVKNDPYVELFEVYNVY